MVRLFKKKQNGKQTLSDTLFDQALAIVDTIPKHKKARIQSHISQRLAFAGRFDQALRVAKSISDSRSKEHALFHIAFSLAQTGQTERSEKIMRHVHRLRKKNRKGIQYGPAHHECELYENDEDEMTKEDIQRNADTAVNPAKKGQIDDAIDATSHIWHDESKEVAFAGIIEALLKEGQFDRALDVANTIDDLHDKKRAFLEIVSAQAKAGQVDRALTLMKTLPGTDHAMILRYIAEALAVAGQTDPALTLVNSIDDAEEKALALAYISLTLAKAGN